VPATQRASGLWAAAASGSVTPTLPTHVASDQVVVWVAYKSSAIATCVASTATPGWAKIGEFVGGSVNSGVGTGSVNIAAFWKEATSSSETNPTITFSQTVTQVGHIANSFAKSAGETWSTPVGAGGAWASTTNVSAAVASHIPVAANDYEHALLAVADDSGFTARGMTQAGVTFGTVVTIGSLVDATGDDGAYTAIRVPVTGGPSSSAAVITGTLAVAETGSVWQTRLRAAVVVPETVPRSTPYPQVLPQ
jgi:hypothetical protein